MRNAGLVVLMLFALCAVGAHAEDYVVTAKVKSGVESMKLYPDLLTLTVKKADGTNAPDGTTLHLRSVQGDAKVLDTASGKFADRTDLTTTNGEAKATVQMGSDARSEFIADVTTAGSTGSLKTPIVLDTNEILGSGEILDCGRKDADGNELTPTQDCREDDTTFTFYMGYAVNTFAAPALQGTAAEAQERNANSSDIIAGIDFSHAIFRRNAASPHRGELWVYGETLHGIASTNNCSGEDTEEKQECTEDAAPESLNGIIEGANTLEAYAGLRYEPQWWPLLDETGSRFYFKAQAGFISIIGHGNDLIDNHHVGAGITKVHGKFTDSYFEIGYGRNDLFAVRNKGRWKADGLVTMNMKYPEIALIRPFIQLTVDSDVGRGGDSVQTFFGLDFDLTLLQVFSVPGRR